MKGQRKTGENGFLMDIPIHLHYITVYVINNSLWLSL